MFKRHLNLRALKNAPRLMLEVFVLAALLLSGVAGRPALAEGRTDSLAGVAASAPLNQGGPDDTVDAQVPSTAEWTSCVPVQVLVRTERIHVKCAAAVSGGIVFFAVGPQDAAHAARVLSLLTTAQVAGRTLSILYDPADDQSGTQIGCAPSNCRLILAVGFGQ